MTSSNQRNRRSEEPTEALHFLYEACRERGGFELLALADERGDFISGSSTTQDLSPGAMRRILMKVLDVPFELCVHGAGDEREVEHALAGTHRILAA